MPRKRIYRFTQIYTDFPDRVGGHRGLNLRHLRIPSFLSPGSALFPLHTIPLSERCNRLELSTYDPYLPTSGFLGVVQMRVTTAEFMKNYGTLADQALIEPVTITKDGRDRLVVVSAEEYGRLARRDRRVIRPEDLSAAEIDLIAMADVPAEHAHLDAELA